MLSDASRHEKRGGGGFEPNTTRGVVSVGGSFLTKKNSHALEKWWGDVTPLLVGHPLERAGHSVGDP
jgi:hypothetical protein